MARAFPSLSVYSVATLAGELCSIERAQRLHAERDCNGDYSVVKVGTLGAYRRHVPEMGERAARRIARRVGRWRSEVARLSTLTVPDGEWIDTMATVADGIVVELCGDPRGAVLHVRLPGDAQAVAL
jgi:hypothetical protein